MKYLGLFIVAVTFFSCKNKDVYVDINQLYSGFEMSKEAENRFTTIENARNTILDSLRLELDLLGNKIELSTVKKKDDLIASYREKQNAYLIKKQQFDKDNQLMIAQENKKIISQLNTYIKEFGKENKYDYLYGANGNGTLLYADKKHEVTAEAIAYVNKKYSGE